MIADAQVELGRYSGAARTLQRLVSLKPTLAAYSRVSYFRELHGDLDGAVRRWGSRSPRRAAARRASPTSSPCSASSRSTAATTAPREHAYREALAADPGFPAGGAGLARVEAAQGRLGAAIDALPRGGRPPAAPRVCDRSR